MMSTRAVIALVKIIKHAGYVPRTKLDACETLLEYESRDDVVEFVKKYLATVYEYEGDDLDARAPTVDDRLRALKLTRKFEAARVRGRTVVATPPSTGEPVDFTYLAEREARQRERQDERARRERETGTVETMDEIRERLKLMPAKSP